MLGDTCFWLLLFCISANLQYICTSLCYFFVQMKEKIDCFLLCDGETPGESILTNLHRSTPIRNIYLMVAEAAMHRYNAPKGCLALPVEHPFSTKTLCAVAEQATAEYVLISCSVQPFSLGYKALERMVCIANDVSADWLYSDYYTEENQELCKHPVIDYQMGSLRDDFDFGQLLLVRTQTLKNYIHECVLNDTAVQAYLYAGLYQFRLYVSRKGTIHHVREFLYTRLEDDLRLSGEKQFDYVNPLQRERQIEMEQAVTLHLSKLNALIDTNTCLEPDFNEQPFDVEASVVIPVYNRVKTIMDAVDSALSQKTPFKYNVLVVDNHSTDGTSQLLARRAQTDDRLVHIVPQRNDLGIGGCWNTAVHHEKCGRFVVQLDSDDLYSSPHTLKSMVLAFYEQKAAMVIGSYRICDFQLNTLPPGLIDHREWTPENGPNNALRINGLGAPRAFFTPLVRQFQFPNTSYGEDYALGLLFSRNYKVGRLYNELYLCRRWEGNSDAALNIDKVNANNLYKDGLRTIELQARIKQNATGNREVAGNAVMRFFYRELEQWETARQNFKQLNRVLTKPLHVGGNEVMLQCNPARMVSTSASLNAQVLQQRPCFLCANNRPDTQKAKSLGTHFELLVNPFPILPVHFTIAHKEHIPQQIRRCYKKMMALVEQYPQMLVFYNGPKCGASAPDHCHLQAGWNAETPLQQAWMRLCRQVEKLVIDDDNNYLARLTGYVAPAFVIVSNNSECAERLFAKLFKALPTPPGENEPMMNVLAWKVDDETVTVVFPRKKHRPECFGAANSQQFMVSPGALDMAGLMILPNIDDFERMTATQAQAIWEEVGIDAETVQAVSERLRRSEQTAEIPLWLDNGAQPTVSVGIVSGQEICFELNDVYLAKGKELVGRQTVSYSEGGVLWNGELYRELTFVPQKHGASFSLHDVTIGIDFHWERKETQTFQGTLKFLVDADHICAINELPVETYLCSVISSEMKATSSLELLKAHAVISRSWLLAQMQRRKIQKEGADGFFSFVKKENEWIRWYDREDHTVFDVCADDHCQRYQGITKETNPAVAEAVKQTTGQILMSGTEICDARFSKCCGGVSEEFQYCWENTPKSYLTAIRDGHSATLPALQRNDEAEKWIRSNPDAFCNTQRKEVLQQVLNDYDTETSDFYRWKVRYTQQQVKDLLEQKLKLNVGDVLDFIPLERGKSGRISRLKIVGTERSFIIGKELEIRRALSKSHLYSSAFVVDKEQNNQQPPTAFTFTGAGWGHGVGLCQIGAAMMGEEGYAYQDILLHYYQGAQIKTVYTS